MSPSGSASALRAAQGSRHYCWACMLPPDGVCRWSKTRGILCAPEICAVAWPARSVSSSSRGSLTRSPCLMLADLSLSYCQVTSTGC